MDNYLTYEQFGAVGDGHADDMPAIVRTHEEAARLGLPVKAKTGAHYYISPKAATAVICTSTDWSGAEKRYHPDMRARSFLQHQNDHARRGTGCDQL